MLNGHGDDLHAYKDIRINFSSNVYNHFCHAGLFRHLAERLPRIAHYPEPTPRSLEARLTQRLGLKAGEVMVTSGATEAIYLVAQSFRGADAHILSPTFAEYADACRLHAHKVKLVHDLAQAPPPGGLFWFCNPNNPTGSLLPKEEVEALVERHPQTLFVMDASYAAFCPLPQLQVAQGARRPNLLMLHSLTKTYAIPGLRLGYLTGAASLLDRIRPQRMPWAVNQPALDAGHYLLEHHADYVLPLDRLMEERQRVSDGLKALGGIEVWPSDTHMLLCRLPHGQASALKEHLAHTRGILIRDAHNFQGLDTHCFRLAVQTPAENDELLQGIKAWMRS